MTNSEKRKFKRAAIQFKVDYSNVDDFLTSFTSNISEGGLFIKTKKIKPVGTKVRLKFLLPKTEKTIETTGIVTWASDEDPRGEEYVGMGVAFSNIEDDDKKIIKEVLDSLAPDW